MNLSEKIRCLEAYLEQQEETYADSFKGEIALILGDFDVSNPSLAFLDGMADAQEIYAWVNRLTSRIVMRFDEEEESLGDFVWDYLKL